MQRYPVRRTHLRRLTPEEIDRLLRSHFTVHPGADGAPDASFGAIAHLAARPVEKELEIDVRMDPKVPEEVARETIRRYNAFLEEATGFTSKERAKRLKKSASATDGA
ncbi:MAG: DUF5611 family protein [Thermoplasmata archaeon]